MASIIFHPSRLRGTLVAPVSKSEAHRALLLSAIGNRDVLLETLKAPFSDDIRATMNVCEMLGAGLCFLEEGTLVQPRKNSPKAECDVLSSAATFRMTLPVLWNENRTYSLRMNQDLARRVLPGSRELARRNGAVISDETTRDGRCVVKTMGLLKGDRFWVDAEGSSQWTSGMLLALSQKKGKSAVLHTEGKAQSVPYIEMTRRWMKKYGLESRRVGQSDYEVDCARAESPESVTIPGDWTQAASFLCATALGHAVTVQNLNTTSENAQGDEMIRALLADMGLKCRESEEGIWVSNPSHARLQPLQADLSNTPDLFPALSLLCARVGGVSCLKGASRLRMKECDRLIAILELLARLEVKTSYCQETDTLMIWGSQVWHGSFCIHSRGDHRMVMAAALAALEADGPVEVRDYECVSKSWPDFTEQYRALGGIAI